MMSHVGVLLEVPIRNRDRLCLNLDMTVRDEHSNLIVGKVQRNFIRNAVHAIVDGRQMYLVPSYRYSPVFIVCEVVYDKKP